MRRRLQPEKGKIAAFFLRAFGHVMHSALDWSERG